MYNTRFCIRSQQMSAPGQEKMYIFHVVIIKCLRKFLANVSLLNVKDRVNNSCFI